MNFALTSKNIFLFQLPKGPSLSACPLGCNELQRSAELSFKFGEAAESFEGEAVGAVLHSIPVGATLGIAGVTVDRVVSGVNVLAYETVTSEGGGVEEVGELEGVVSSPLSKGLDHFSSLGEAVWGGGHDQEGGIVVRDLSDLEVGVGGVGETWEDVAVDHEISLTFP
jgi:hypothetical protein